MTTYTVGQTLESIEQFDAMPEGTVIHERNNQNNFFTKQGELWHDRYGNAYRPGDFSMGYNIIREFPGGKATSNGFVPSPLSLQQYQWKYRTHAVASAVDHGVGMQQVHRAMEELGVRLGTDFPLGHGVPIVPSVDHEALPVGTQVMVGHPARVETFGLFVKATPRNGFTWVLGDQRSLPTRAVIAEIPGVEGQPEWMTAPAAADADEAILHFKAQAYRVGFKVKRNNSWCDTYDRLMAQVGVKRDVLSQIKHHGMAVGDTVDSVNAMMLPVGSLLMWRSSEFPDVFAVYRREDASTNRAGTRRVLGVKGEHDLRLGHMKDRMTVGWIANDEDQPSVNLGVLIREAAPQVPIGTWFWSDNERTMIYVKARDGRIASMNADYPRSSERVPATGPYEAHQFRAGRMHFSDYTP